MQIAAARVVKGADGVTPGGGEIVEVVLQIRVDVAVDGRRAAAKMQHARAWNGHFRLGIAADAFQEAEIFQHRMIAKRHFTGDAHALRFGLDAVELDALIHFHQLHALQRAEEVEMPPGAAKFAVGYHMQAAGALLLNGVTNRVVFDLTQVRGVYLPCRKLLAGLLNGIRA